MTTTRETITTAVLYGSTVVLWATVLASIVYSLRDFPTPFKDSLTPAQLEIKKASAQERRQFYYGALFVSLGIVSAAAYALAKL